MFSPLHHHKWLCIFALIPNCFWDRVLELKFLLLYTNWPSQCLYQYNELFQGNFFRYKSYLEKMTVFFCFVGTFWTRKCAVLVFRKSSPRQKLCLKKKNKGYAPVEKCGSGVDPLCFLLPVWLVCYWNHYVVVLRGERMRRRQW